MRPLPKADEAATITWMRAEMGWNQTLPEKLYSDANADAYADT